MIYYQLLKKAIDKRSYPDDSARRAAWGTAGSSTGIVVNVLLAAVKFLVGTLSGSVSATADAVNNLSDAGGSLMSLISVRIAGHRETAKNPFGFGRMEYIGALGVGALILMMGFDLLKSGVMSIISPEAVAFSWLSLILLCLSVLGKIWLYRAYVAIGKPIQNTALLAAAKDSLSDCIATSAVIISMLLSRFAGWKIDGVIGVLVSLLILKAGYDVLSDTVTRLLGGAADKELGSKIIERVKSYPYVQDIHDFIMHDYGPGRCMASIHVEVPADGNLVAMHEVIDRMERDIHDELHVPLCVHMDPVVESDESTDSVKRMLREYLAVLNPPMHMHDFRVVPGENQINLIFDVVLPPAYDKPEELEKQLSVIARGMDSRYHCVIHFDKDYYHA